MTQLIVQFKSGGLYTYAHVTRAHFEALLRAPSKGQFINHVIKPAFPAARLDGTCPVTLIGVTSSNVVAVGFYDPLALWVHEQIRVHEDVDATS